MYSWQAMSKKQWGNSVLVNRFPRVGMQSDT